MNKIFKILIPFGIGFFIFYLGVVISYNFFYFLHQKELERQQKELREILLKPYMEDTYGGKTPQETFDMFLEALKKGDIELASKYFVLDRREKLKKELEEIVEDGYLDELIEDLSRAKIEQSPYTGMYRFVLYNEDESYRVLVPVERIASGVWKITDF